MCVRWLMMDTSRAHLFNFFFFFNDTATTEIYTLSLHDALPISLSAAAAAPPPFTTAPPVSFLAVVDPNHVLPRTYRSEEHTSELQSQSNLVCRLLLEKKKKHHHEAIPLFLTGHTFNVTVSTEAV